MGKIFPLLISEDIVLMVFYGTILICEQVTDVEKKEILFPSVQADACVKL